MNYTDEISEMTLLCQMIMDKSIIPDVQTKVVKECFTQELTRKGYEICIEKQSILDAKVFVKEMKDFNAGSVQDIISATYSSDNWNYYADKIIDLFIKRSVHRICLEHKDPSEEKTGFEELSELNAKIVKIGDQGTGSGIHDTKKALELLYQSIEKAYNNKGMGNYTNIDELDKLTGGIQNELIVIGARPSIGKTALGLQIAAEQSRNYPVAIFSMEMATESLMRRRVSSLTGIPSDIIRNGMLTNANLLSIQNAMGEIYEKENLKIIDNERRMDKLEAIARKLVRSDGVKLLLFDHFSLTEHENKKLNRNDQFADLANRYQKLRKELKVPIILLCQLRRDAENKEPILADLRETGNMEQNADTIIFIHRDREYDPTIREIETKLIVAKQRDGPIGIANTLFVPKRQMFINAMSPHGDKEKL